METSHSESERGIMIMIHNAERTSATPPLSMKSSTPIPANVFATRCVKRWSVEERGVSGGRAATAASCATVLIVTSTCDAVKSSRSQK